MEEVLQELITRLRQQPGINRLQGTAKASVFVIAPVPGELELRNNLCWCNEAAKKFFSMLELACGKPMHFLVMPTTFDGKKPVKANTQFPKIILTRAAFNKAIEQFICIGSDAFKTYFGHGKKPSMPSLIGNVIYVKETNNKPLYVFPDQEGLFPVDESVYGDNRRLAMIARNHHLRVTATYGALCKHWAQTFVKGK